MNRAFFSLRMRLIFAALVYSGAAFPADYHTEFSAGQCPIREGGAWHHSASPWRQVCTKSGLAIGTQTGNGGYDDSYALLSGFTADHGAEAVVRRAPNLDQSCSHEVEILLRCTDTANTVRCYEAMFPFAGSVQIVRWEGPFGSFTPIGTSVGVTLKQGDRVRAEIVGNQITAYHNDDIVAEATDSATTDGQPGVGFFRRACGTNADLAFTSFDAYDIDTEQSITVCQTPESMATIRGKLLNGPQLDPERTPMQAATELPAFDKCATYTK